MRGSCPCLLHACSPPALPSTSGQAARIWWKEGPTRPRTRPSSSRARAPHSSARPPQSGLFRAWSSRRSRGGSSGPRWSATCASAAAAAACSGGGTAGGPVFARQAAQCCCGGGDQGSMRRCRTEMRSPARRPRAPRVHPGCRPAAGWQWCRLHCREWQWAGVARPGNPCNAKPAGRQPSARAHERTHPTLSKSASRPERRPPCLTGGIGAGPRQRQLRRHRAQPLGGGAAHGGVAVPQRPPQQAKQLAQQRRLEHGTPVQAALLGARRRHQRQTVPATELAGLGGLSAGGVQQRGQRRRLHLLLRGVGEALGGRVRGSGREMGGYAGRQSGSRAAP